MGKIIKVNNTSLISRAQSLQCCCCACLPLRYQKGAQYCDLVYVVRVCDKHHRA